MRSLTLAVILGLSVHGLAAAEPPRAADRPATIDVWLPADATLTFNGTPTTSTSAYRAFVTPPLPAGKTFYYTLKAQVVRGGKTMTEQQRIAVRAGQGSVVSFQLPQPDVSYFSARRSSEPHWIYYRGSPVRPSYQDIFDRWKPDQSDPFFVYISWD
jgi:uncharacterized protein (TIGR03000 family)